MSNCEHATIGYTERRRTAYVVAYSRFLNADADITVPFSYENGKAQMLYDLTKILQENKIIADDPKHAETITVMKKLFTKGQAKAAK